MDDGTLSATEANLKLVKKLFYLFINKVSLKLFSAREIKDWFGKEKTNVDSAFVTRVCTYASFILRRNGTK